jgi:hypothetical protein
LEKGQRRYAFDNSGLVKVDSIFDPHRPTKSSLLFNEVQKTWLHFSGLAQNAASKRVPLLAAKELFRTGIVLSS